MGAEPARVDWRRDGLPRFVVREVEEYLRCRLLEHGCVRVGCCRLVTWTNKALDWSHMTDFVDGMTGSTEACAARMAVGRDLVREVWGRPAAMLLCAGGFSFHGERAWPNGRVFPIDVERAQEDLGDLVDLAAFAPASGARALGRGDLARLEAGLDEFARALVGGLLSRRLHSMMAGESEGRRPTFAFALREKPRDRGHPTGLGPGGLFEVTGP